MRRQLREEPLSKHTSFRIGGPADFYYEPESVEEIRALLAHCGAEGIQTAVIGNGSNLLVGDKGFRGAVIRLGAGFGAITVQECCLQAEAGAALGKLARTAAEANLSGLAFAAGIPGTVGGALVMNAGAYGSEIKDILECTELLFPDGSVREVGAEELDFSYRHSNISARGAIVLSATFRLRPGEREEILEEMQSYAAFRREKQPLEFPSAGSAFKRPAGDVAARLLDAAGCKGLRIGGAAISEKHAGFLVNLDHASAADVRAVLREAAARVEAQSGVRLEPEICFLGEF